MSLIAKKVKIKRNTLLYKPTIILFIYKLDHI